MILPRYDELMAGARRRDDVNTLAFAGVMAMAGSRAAPYHVPITGLDRADMAALMADHFPLLDARRVLGAIDPTAALPAERGDEFFDLVDLLFAHRGVDTANVSWVARAIATASMGQNHLWQDMGLPDRRVLSRLIEWNFPSLFARNSGDMKWKKFFYRQLCEQAEVLICKSPSCGVCVDHQLCFGHAEAASPAAQITMSAPVPGELSGAMAA